MADPRLLRRLDQVGARLRFLRALWTATWGWLALIVAVTCLRITGQITLAWSIVLFGVPLVLLTSIIASTRRKGDRHAAAVLIEQTYPQLDARLLTAVQQQPRGHGWDFSFLQSELLTEVFSQLRRQDWHRAVASSLLWKAHGAHAAALLTLVVLLVPMWKSLQNADPSRASAANGSHAGAGSKMEVLVEPGNAEVERGSGLLVLAKFPGHIPADVELVTTDSAGKTSRLPLQKSLNDPVFGGRISSIERDCRYHLEFAGQTSEEFQVTAFDYPALVKADANVTFPSYTELESKKIEDVRRLTVVEGSVVDLQLQFNKALQSATLIDEAQNAIELKSDGPEGLLKTISWSLTTPGEKRYKLHLEDESGRANRDPEEFCITVTENRTPDLQVSFPMKDLRVSALQELLLNARASDDFGLKGLGLIYQTPGGTEETIDFARTAAPDEPAQVEHLFAMEQLNVKPDDLLSYYFYAEDIGPDGRPRRSFSDIYFAEVRPFEEIFRQVPPSPRQNGDGECKKLLELQRQVVAASWNVIRRESPERLSQKFGSEVKTLEESETQIRKITQMLKSSLDDPLLQQYADEALHYMSEAIRGFSQAAVQSALPPVVDGRTAAQSAYQSLLKLQSRETLLKQSQGASSQAAEPKNNMNQQLQALKLKNDRDRYETERQAKGEQNAAAKESLQILNRLKELARRQEDLNNRIRELESSLRDAKTAEQKQEIERQLQRLQADQEELLRHLDEVRERMNQEQNRAQTTEARQQADQIRERVFNSSEALKEGQTQKALNEGTRAERQLHELEDQFRKQTAGQFDTAMRQLRDDARQLAHQQDELSEKLKAPQTGRPVRRKSLGNDPQADDSLAGQVRQQKENLQNILDRARQLVQDSELNEPLLSKKLYDSIRNVRKHQPEEALDSIAQLTERGIRGPVPSLEEKAREGIRELQAGIENAADSILGNEESALRQARADLSQLIDSLREELEANGQAKTPQAGPKQPQDVAQSEQKPGQPGSPSQKSPSREEQSKQNLAQGNFGRERNSSQPSPQSGKPGETGQGSSGTEKQPRNSQASSGQNPSGQNPGKPGSQPGSRAPDALTVTIQSASPGALEKLLQQQLALGGSQNAGGTGPEEGPLTGGRFTQWSEQLRDVEEMLTTPELRSQVATIRDRARLERINIKRHSNAPDWELIRTSIYGPLLELQAQIDEELARRDPESRLVPVDRDPVPERYSDFVKSYYEQLSRQKGEN